MSIQNINLFSNLLHRQASWKVIGSREEIESNEGQSVGDIFSHCFYTDLLVKYLLIAMDGNYLYELINACSIVE